MTDKEEFEFVSKVWERAETIPRFTVTGWHVAAPATDEEYDVPLATGVHISAIRPCRAPDIPVWEKETSEDPLEATNVDDETEEHAGSN